jgi:hypothetical protein
MITKKEHVKILTILSLAASDTREDTIRSIVINTLFELGAIKRSEVCNQITELYEFEPYQDEILSIFDVLLDEGKIVKTTDLFELSSVQRAAFVNAEVLLRDKEHARFQNFKNFITDDLMVVLETSQIKMLWAAFVEYLYNSFYEFGEEALSMFHPALNSGGKLHNQEDFVQEAMAKLKYDKKLCEVFKETVDKFPDYASQQDLEFLNELAQKTQSFASLGFNPAMTDAVLERSLVDWTLYLDTNVLYSILNLHSHPESEACKALISLIVNNQQYLKIVLRYSELTKIELNGKRDDFSTLDIKLSNSAIKAMLRTNDLDPFSNQFYQNLLDNRSSTVHPSTIIDLSATIFLNDGIDISRNKKRVEQIGEEYLNVRIQEYRRFIDYKNDVRREYSAEKGGNFRNIYRSDKQIKHDITLREIILSQRAAKTTPNQAPTLNSVKYYAVTLDEILIDFDKNELRQGNTDRAFPVFFRPSFLLNKLVKVLPIKTDDYKKAFIKAITSKGFNRDVQKSQDIQSIVNYLKSQGIDNEEVVYNLISEELFLEKYKKEQYKPGFNQGDFIESQLNVVILAREGELQKTREELAKQSEEATTKGLVAQELAFKKQSLEQERELYKNAAVKLSKDLNKEQRRGKQVTAALSIDFEAEERNKEVNQLKFQNAALFTKLQEDYRDKAFRKWQQLVWWNLFWALPITIIMLILMFDAFLTFPTGFDAGTQKIVFSSIIVVIDGFFGFLVKSRYFDEGNMDKRKQRIKLPAELNPILFQLPNS